MNKINSIFKNRLIKIKYHYLLYYRKDRDHTLMLLECEKQSSSVITITLSGPNFMQLNYAKKIMMGILRLARHFHVERELIVLERKMKGKYFSS